MKRISEPAMNRRGIRVGVLLLSIIWALHFSAASAFPAGQSDAADSARRSEAPRHRELERNGSDRHGEQQPAKGRPKVALVLGGGGAWGAAHIGVLEVLEENDIAVDMIAGTSAGAVAAAFYLDGYDTEALSKQLAELSFLEVLRPSFGGMGFFRIDPVEEYFAERLECARIEDFSVPLAITATDVDTGEAVTFTSGPLAKLLAASAAVPVVFDPMEYEGMILADGGVVDNVPVFAAQEMGADKIIAVNVGGSFSFEERPANRIQYANRIYNIMRKALYSEYEVDVYINPDLTGISGTDFGAHAEITARGREAAEAALQELKKLRE